MNQRSPRRQSISRSLVRNEAAIIRTRLCMKPVAASSRMPASRSGSRSGRRTTRETLPLDRVELAAEGAVLDVGVVEQDLGAEARAGVERGVVFEAKVLPEPVEDAQGDLGSRSCGMRPRRDSVHDAAYPEELTNASN